MTTLLLISFLKNKLMMTLLTVNMFLFAIILNLNKKP